MQRRGRKSQSQLLSIPEAALDVASALVGTEGGSVCRGMDTDLSEKML